MEISFVEIKGLENDKQKEIIASFVTILAAHEGYIVTREEALEYEPANYKKRRWQALAIALSEVAFQF